MKDAGPTAAHSSALNKCAKCGACTVVCPVYRASGNEVYSARGKRHLAEVLGGDRPGPVFEDIYSKCLLCGACRAVCPRQLDIPAEVTAARAAFSPLYGEHGYQKFLARKALNRPELLGAARVLGRRAAAILFGRLPAGSGLRLRLALFADQEAQAEQAVDRLPNRAGVTPERGMTYFPGCATHYLYPEIGEAVRELLADCGYDLQVPAGLGCCGLATLAAGDPDGARQQARHNISRLELSDGPIMVSCGSCFAHLGSYPALFGDDEGWRTRARLVSERVVEMSRFVDMVHEEEEAPELAGVPTLRVFYHDPCHLRHGAGITVEPRALLRRLPAVELVELPDGPQCCGQGGLFHLGAPELSATIRDDLAAKVLALRPDVITTTCSGCLMQWKSAVAAAGSSVPVLHLAALVRQRVRPTG